MVIFHVPQRGTNQTAGGIRFSVPQQSVAVAGSRRGTVPAHTASLLVAELSRAGFSFLVGCAPGIDACFRHTLSVSERSREHSFIACAFARRAEAIGQTGLFASVVVPHGVHPKAALRRRTLWMVKRSGFLLLFPDDPATGRWGRGSGLAFRAAVDQLKPVFVVTAKPPAASLSYHLLPASFSRIVDGYWVVPHPVAEGSCDEEL